MIQILKEDLWCLMLCSFRYSMGRMTYMPSAVRDMYKGYKKYLLPEQRLQIINEVKKELEICERCDTYLGMDFDYKAWKNFVEEELKAEQT